MYELYNSCKIAVLLILILSTILPIASILINTLVNLFILRPGSYKKRITKKHVELYKFEVTPISKMHVIKSFQSFKLASLSLIFNLKITSLVPSFLMKNITSTLSGSIMLFHIFCIVFSIFIKIKNHVITFYKNKKIKTV